MHVLYELVKFCIIDTIHTILRFSDNLFSSLLFLLPIFSSENLKELTGLIERTIWVNWHS